MIMFKESKKMFQCSHCTSGSAFVTQPEKKCETCGINSVHVC